jgi:hypothetical protein
MDYFHLLQTTLLVVLIGVLVGISGVLFQAFCVLKQVRRIMDRVELLTDIKGWLNIARKFSRKRSTSKS